MSWRWLLCLWVWLSTLAGAAPESYTRVHGSRFQTALTRFQKGPVLVDLVAVVHIAEASYYGRLNQYLRNYPCVLYELIAQPPGDINREELYELVGMEAPPANPIPARGESNTDTTRFQRQLCEKMALSFQLDEIDYGALNFLHADLTPRQLDKLLKGRQDPPKAFFDKLLENMGGSPAERLEWSARFMAPTNPVNQRRLRQLMARLLCDPVEFDRSLRGPESEIYLEKRNAKALKVLRGQLGKGTKKVAIFYGAAHMPDLARRLTKELGFRRISQSWLSAWRL